MRFALPLAAVAALAFAGPVLAQTAETAPPAQSAETAAEPADTPPSPEEAAMEAAGQQFEQQMRAMVAELTAAKTAAGADSAKANADADAIQAKYQPQADAFADQLAAFVVAQGDAVPADKRAQIDQAVAQVHTLPAQIRTGVMSAPAEAPAPAAPQ